MQKRPLEVERKYLLKFNPFKPILYISLKNHMYIKTSKSDMYCTKNYYYIRTYSNKSNKHTTSMYKNIF